MTTNRTLPTAFDTSLGGNFTQSSCPEFFAFFLRNESFVGCHPMSFYLKNSQSYFETVKAGLESVEQVLDISCGVDFNRCSAIMEELGSQLIDSSRCQSDFRLKNLLVTQAYNDFLAYGEVYNAVCLKIPAGETANAVSKSSRIRRANVPTYCYTSALFESRPDDAYLYLLPLGIAFPDSANLSCSDCNQKVMDIYHSYTNDTTSSLYSTYESAATILDKQCSSDFVNATTIAGSSNGGAHKNESLLKRANLTLLLLFILSILVI